MEFHLSLTTLLKTQIFSEYTYNLTSFIVTLPESRIHKNFSNWDLMEGKVWKAVLLWARLCPICHSMIRHDNEIGPLLHSCYQSHGGQKCHLLLPFYSKHLTHVWRGCKVWDWWSFFFLLLLFSHSPYSQVAMKK